VTADLREDRDFLLASIRDLDAEFLAGDIDEVDYRALRDDYTARAASVLRRIEGARGPGVVEPGADAVATTPPIVRSRSRTRRERRTRGAALVALVGVVAGLAGFAVAESAGERNANDQATGSLPEGSTDRITRAQTLVSEGKILEAVKVYDSLLADDPGNPVALAQKGWLLSLVDASLVDAGLASIDKAIAADPTYPESYFFRGMILWKAKDDPAAGAAAFQQGIDTHPPAELVAVLTAKRDEARAASGTTTTAP
jgi:tetratricopeptide (TPR) repeat protein